MGGCLALGKSKEDDDHRNTNTRVFRTASRLPQSSSGASSSNPRNDNLGASSSNPRNDNRNTNIRFFRTALRLPQSSSGATSSNPRNTNLGASRSNPRNNNSGASSSNPRNDNLSAVSNARRANLPKNDSRDGNAFTHLEIVTATDKFNQANFLGQGGFGRVYKGNLKRLQQVVAVKQIHFENRESPQRKAEFDAEVMTLSSTDHPNIVKLHGYCLEGIQRDLVYEYMPLTSLNLHLHAVGPDRKALDWNTRMKIAAGIAHALEYLHKTLEPPIIHGDVKSSIILLGENYHPKLSGFGLSIEGPTAHVTTMGTSGYSAPEDAKSGQVTFKSDIYSFGVVLLEILTGRKVHYPSRPPNDQTFVNWARPLFKFSKRFGKMADPSMGGVFPKNGFKQAMYVAAVCVNEDPGMRQEMSKIIPYLDLLAAIPFPPIPLPTIAETSEHSGSSSSMTIERDPPNSLSSTAQRELPSSSGNSSGDTTLADHLVRISNVTQRDQPSTSGNN